MNFRSSFSCLSLATILFASAAAFGGAAPVRKASQNGTDSSQPSMNLFGPTAGVPRHGGILLLSTQMICPNQDVADSRALDGVTFNSDVSTLKQAGSCLSGLYKFLFQIQPTTTLSTLTVTISNLVGFTPGTDPNVSFNNPTYGIQICDNNDPASGNTLELCTNLAAAQLPAVTATVGAKNNKVVFTVTGIGPTTVPAGPDYTGAGLTFEVVVQQVSGTPIAAPKISFK